MDCHKSAVEGEDFSIERLRYQARFDRIQRMVQVPVHCDQLLAEGPGASPFVY